jgi:chromosomal replication initiator protein
VVEDLSVTDPEALWRTSLTQVLPDVESPVQRRWLEATHPVGFSDGTLVIASPHGFARDWLERNWGVQLRAKLSDIAGGTIALLITVQTNPDATSVVSDDEALAHDPVALVSHAAAARNEIAAAHPSSPLQPGLAHAAVLAELNRGAADDYDALAVLDHLEENPLYDVPLQAPGRPAGPTVAHTDHGDPRRAGGNGRGDGRGSGQGGGSLGGSGSQRRIRNQDIEPDTRLNPRYSFDDFVIGASNRFAHAAANAVAEQPAKSYNPLFIYGGAGLGKTHLLHAIGHYVRKLYPRLNVRYVTTEQFTNEFINAIRDDSTTAFQRLYRMTDVLLVDDVQFLQSKERTQEEFFHTFNALHNAEKQIVLSSDRPPKQIGQLEERLRSRFEWGLITDIQPPDLETRIAILRKKAESDRLGVSDAVLEVIAAKVSSNIRELEGALIRVSAFASLQRLPADIEMADFVLKDLFPDGRDRIISVQDIIDEVAQYFSITAEELCSASRSRQLVNARQIAMYLTRELTDLSLPRIGRAFGNRDHSTVMHATQKITGLMTERRATYDQVQELTNRITSTNRRPR